VVLLRDKASFFLGVVNLLAAEFVLIRFPDYFPLLFSFWFPMLMALRLYFYAEAHYEFFLIDYCYFVNFIGLVHVWLAPESPFVFGMFYAAATGPVCVAILAWRNALVFHSLDKITTLFIHSFPAMLAFSQRWLANTTHSRECGPSARYRPGDGLLYGTVYLFPGEQQVIGGEAGHMETCTPPHSSLTLMVAGLSYYVFWQIIYLLITEVVCGAYLSQHPEELTSMRYFIERGQKTALYRIVASAMRACGLLRDGDVMKIGEFRTLMTFVLSQLLYTVITMLPPLLFQGNVWLSSLWLLAIGLNAVWNGATYYIQIFSRRYADRFSEMFAQKGKGSKDRIVADAAGGDSNAHADKGKGKDKERGGTGGGAEARTSPSGQGSDQATEGGQSADSARSTTGSHISSARSETSSVGSSDDRDRAYHRAFVMGIAAASVMDGEQQAASDVDPFQAPNGFQSKKLN